MSAPTVPVCSYCGSSDVSADAAARWCIETQRWEITNVFDDVLCDQCGEEGEPEWHDQEVVA